MAIKKGQKTKIVKIPHEAKLADGTVDKFFATYVRGSGKSDLKALQEELAACNDDDHLITQVLRRYVVQIDLTDDDKKPISWEENENDIWEFVMERPAYSGQLLRGALQSAGDLRFEDDRRKN